MLIKKYIFLFIIYLFYQNPLYSKSNSFNDVDPKNLSKYFSGIVAYENNENTTALNFFNSSKILLDKHDPFLKRYIFSLVLENKVQNAISVIKKNNEKSNSNFFDAYLLLILDSLKKNDFNKADLYLQKTSNLVEIDRFNLALLESIKQFIYVFKEKKNFEQ